MEPEDLELLYDIENDPTLWNDGASNVPYSRYTLQDYIATALNDIYADHQVRMMIENSEGRAVGIVDLVNFDPTNQRAELGLVIQPDCRRQGYARAAVRAVCDYAQRQLHLHQLYAYIATDNKACVELFRSEGAHESNVLTDWLFDGKRYQSALLFQIIL